MNELTTLFAQSVYVSSVIIINSSHWLTSQQTMLTLHKMETNAFAFPNVKFLLAFKLSEMVFGLGDRVFNTLCDPAITS